MIRSIVWQGVSLFAMSIVIGATSAHAQSAYFDVAGSPTALWVVGRVEGPTANQPILRFAYRTQADPEFRPPSGGNAVVGDVDRLAVADSTLHVMYRDGAHWRQDDTGQTIAAGLPGRAKPLAWAAQPSAAGLYAVVDGDTFVRVTEAARGRSLAPTSQGTPGSAVDLAGAFRERPKSAGLVRLSGDGWVPVDALLIPSWFDGLTDVQLVVDRDDIHLVFRGDESREWAHAMRSDADWSSLASTGIPIDAPLVAAMNVNRLTIAVYATSPAEESGGHVLRIQQFRDDSWSAGPYLNVAGEPRRFDVSNLAVTFFGQHVVTAERDSDTGIRVGLWRLADGAFVDGSEQTAELKAAPTPVVGEDMARWLLMATTVLLLLGIMRRRRFQARRNDEKKDE